MFFWLFQFADFHCGVIPFKSPVFMPPCRKAAIAEILRRKQQKSITGYAKSCRCNFRKNLAPTVLGLGRIPITQQSFLKKEK